MADPTPQTYANHVRRLPRPYLAAAVMLGLNIVGTTALVVRHPDIHTFGMLGVAIALFGIAWYTRGYALVVQNRIIRLEERIRLEKLLPEDLKPRIGELSVGQLVALRFASDAELPELTRQVLTENLTDQDQIKQRVRGWRADHLRV